MSAQENHPLDSAATQNTNPAHADWFNGRGVVLLAAIFFVTMLPIVVAGSRYFGDEHFYTDGAIRMVQKGDYFTPYYMTDDGLPHFNKPIFTYWMVATSYLAFGISFLSSRLPFLIAGCLLLWVTYKTSLMLVHRPQESFVAAVIILSDFLLFSSSPRSTPDIFQCLFLSASLYGFMDIIFNRNKTVMNYGLAYVGAALAVETKGIPGFFPIIFAFLFCSLRRRHGVKPSDLFDWRSIIAGATIALFWFVVVYCKRGNAALQGFYADQVSNNLHRDAVTFLANCWYYLRESASFFFPWFVLVLLALCLDAKAVRSFFREHREVCLFVGAWYLVFLMIFSMAGLNRGRYMFPTHPLLAVVISSLLARVMNESRAARLIRRTFSVFLLSGVVYGFVLILAGAFIAQRMLVGGVLALCVTLALYVISRRTDYHYGFAALGLCLFFMFSIQDIFVRPNFDISPAPMMTQRLLQRGLQGGTVIGVGLERFTLSNIEVLSGGLIEGRNLRATTAPGELDHYTVLLLSNSVRQRWNAQGYNVEECGYTLAQFNVSDLWTMITRQNKETVFATKKTPFYLAVRQSS